MKTIEDVQSASTADLVAFYNSRNPTAQIKKFADRKTAERRCALLLPGNEPNADLKAAAAPAPAPAPKAGPVLGFTKRAVAKKAPATIKPIKKGKAPVKAAKKARTSGSVDLSEAQRKLWKDPEIRESRSERSAVSVDGVEYKSVRAAFEELELPMSQHIRFRGRLKEAIKLNEYGHKWAIIPLNY